ncbi:precorrin-6y C5,15-methyltransferase (decarboxylating) subunit CbiE [Actinocrispum wychmicini]|uniref:Precorrin-6Y C5,15-methyltransferase (Decarboxylating) n=1 Tax=Actinocrispum wychmicini TaxID=1213861 RepID=A0A4V2S692_9PSEU|nr:precorrin-6y C5,15-methyltransferase (decarboxylating) subunit CbiE [Actinocrispum wychmicini]TCO55140.1 precorrin-6Y C5,15-methyltransferase (decarboxylating) [Actinocrispum wychmicini]
MGVTVVGIGADGWDGLTSEAQSAVLSCDVLMGSRRQLELVPTHVQAVRVAWPSPMMPAVPALLAEHRDQAVCVLASGDPMFYGVGSKIGPARVVPHVSSVSLACARLGWPVEDVHVIRHVTELGAVVHPGRRLLVLSADADSPAAVADHLVSRGYGASELTVLSNLGGNEGTVSCRAEEFDGPVDPLNVVAVECRGSSLLPNVPGLPDETFEHDGQLTKREVRAITLSRLVPVPGQLLWDVGAGAGSIAIEWCRTHPSCRAIAIEQSAERAERILRNAAALGVPKVSVVVGSAPDALDLEAPDAVFVGGGVTGPGMVERCWDALRPGGRLVVNAVTVQAEAVVARWHAELGGDLVRIAISRGSPVGGFTGWRPMMPVTVWTVSKEER